MNVWEHPAHYAGHSPVGDYLIYQRDRDSDILTNVNYREILRDLQSHDETGEAVYDFRTKHWAVGWVEYIIVKRDAPQALIEEAERITADLEDYDIYDEEAYSEAQYDAITDYWDELTIESRIWYCRNHGVSIFAARRGDEVPEGIYTYLQNTEFC